MAFRTNKTPVLQEKSASGSVATFNTALAMPLPSCKIAVNGYQEGTGTPSPDNVRPLHAWDKARLFDTQKNLFDMNSDKITGAYISSTGAIVYQAGQDIYTEKIYIKPSTQYTISGKSDTNAIIRIALYSTDNSFIGRVLSTSMQNPVVTIVPTSQASYFVINPDNTITDIQVEEGQQATAYEPFGNTYTFTFGQTVYSANLDVLRGILSITHRYIVLNGSEDWISLNNNKAGYIELTDANIINNYGQAKCSQYRNTSWTDASTTDDGNFTLYQNSSWSKARLVFNFAGGTLETFKTQLNNSNIQVVYKLAEPIEIPLGGIQLLTQEGQNNIFCDTGDVDLTYKDLDIAKRGNFREVFKLPS